MRRLFNLRLNTPELSKRCLWLLALRIELFAGLYKSVAFVNGAVREQLSARLRFVQAGYVPVG